MLVRARAVDYATYWKGGLSQVRKLVLCSGKVYYDLIAERSRRAIDDIAIGRLEQISPFPHDYLQAFNAPPGIPN